jgi:hypothetical protein
MIQFVQLKIVAGLMAILMFGFSGQYLINLASADDSWTDIQKAAAVAQARALQKYENTHMWPLDQSTQYAKLTNTPTDQNVIVDRNVNIANGQAYAAAKAMAIFDQVHVLGLDQFSTGYSGLTNTPTDEHVYMDRNAQIAYARASMDRNNLKIIEAIASIQPKYVGIDNTQTTDQNGRDRNVLIQEGIAKLEQENQDLAAQLASLSTGYAGLDASVTTYSNGGDRQAYIEKTLIDSEARAVAILQEMNVAQGGHYAGIDNTQTTDQNGRDRNVMIQQGIEAVSQKIVGCYDADHPRTCDITSGANYTQYAP